MVFNLESVKRYKDIVLEHFRLYRSFRFSLMVFLGYIYLYLSYQISNEAGKFATQMAGPEIKDTLHSILPKINSKFLHQDFSMVFYYFRNSIFLFFPERVIFAVFTLGTLILTRAVFINLTNLGIPEGAVPIWSNATFGGDLFFSGHVAYSFLIALIFWDIKILRYVFLTISLMLGASSLFGRYHYSIDVFAAPFIAYGVFSICKKFFKYKY